jgi:hypothetical protein
MNTLTMPVSWHSGRWPPRTCGCWSGSGDGILGGGACSAL